MKSIVRAGDWSKAPSGAAQRVEWRVRSRAGDGTAEVRCSLARAVPRASGEDKKRAPDPQHLSGQHEQLGQWEPQHHSFTRSRAAATSLHWREQLSASAFAPRALETALTEPPDAPACILDDD